MLDDEGGHYQRRNRHERSENEYLPERYSIRRFGWSALSSQEPQRDQERHASDREGPCELSWPLRLIPGEGQVEAHGQILKEEGEPFRVIEADVASRWSRAMP